MDADAGKTRQFWSDNLVLGVATVAAGIFNTLYSVVLAHSLGPVRYGLVAGLNNLVGLFLLPLPLVGLAAVRYGKQQGQTWISRGAMGLGALLFLVALLLAPLLGRALKVSDTLILLFSAGLVFNYGYALYVGFLERARRYYWVGFLVGLSSVSALMAVAMAVTVGRHHPLFWLGVWQGLAVLGLFLAARRASRCVEPVPPAPLSRAMVATTVGVGTLQSLWGLSDSLWARVELTPHAAGLYAGLATIGQGLPFLASGLVTVMLTAILDTPAQRRALLVRTIGMVFIIAVTFWGVVTLAPDVVVQVALGRRFLPLLPLVQRYIGAMAALSFVLALTTYSVAIGAYQAMVAAAVGTAGWVVSMAGAHSMAALVNRTVLFMGVTLVLVVVGLGRQYQ